MPIGRTLRRLAKKTKRRVLLTVEILGHPETPWYVRTLAFIVVAYALSPIDLIPDFVPLLGYVDDLILLPLGIALVVLLTPIEIRLEAARAAVRRSDGRGGPIRWIGGAAIVIVWVLAAGMVVWRVLKQ